MNPRSPFTASSLSQTWLHITGRDGWILTAATIFSREWTSLRGQIDSSTGHYHVVFTYWVDGEIYTGRFVDFALGDEEYFHKGDTIEIRYDPKHPSRCYYPGLRTRLRFNLVCCAIGAAAAIIVMLCAALFRGF